MDKQYYASVPQLIGILIMNVGLLIINNNSILFSQTEAVYVISELINLMLLGMLFNTIFSILFSFSMWENNELNIYYKLMNIMILINTVFIPVVLILFGVNSTLTTENGYKLGLLSYNSRCIAHFIETTYYFVILFFSIFGIGLQLNRKK